MTDHRRIILAILAGIGVCHCTTWLYVHLTRGAGDADSSAVNTDGRRMRPMDPPRIESAASPGPSLQVSAGSGAGSAVRGCARRAPTAARSGARRLFDAIRRVESGGDDHAVGDDGASLGPYQIGRDYWYDACQWGGVKWRYDRWVWDRSRCEQVMLWYWERYGARTDEQKAMMHQGGPNGFRNVTPRRLRYWQKVKALKIQKEK